MAFSIAKSDDKATISQSVVDEDDIAFSDLTKISDEQPVCERHNPGTKSVYHRDRAKDHCVPETSSSTNTEHKWLYPQNSTVTRRHCDDAERPKDYHGPTSTSGLALPPILDTERTSEKSTKELSTSETACHDQRNTELLDYNSDRNTKPNTSRKTQEDWYRIEIKPYDAADSGSNIHTTSEPLTCRGVSNWVEDETETVPETVPNDPNERAGGVERKEQSADDDSDGGETIVRSDPPQKLRRHDSRIIMGFGIFERDVELGGVNQSISHDVSDEIVTTARSVDGSDDGKERALALPSLPSSCPPELLKTFGSDPDSIMKAVMRWKREGFFPVTLSSSNDSNGSICRICHSGDSLECLLNPCRCEGTVKWTHQTCLMKWLAEKGVLNCELCGARYRFKRTGTRNCFRWKPIQLTLRDKLHLIAFAFAGAFLLVTFTFVAWVSAKYYSDENKERSPQSEVIFPVYSCFDAFALFIVCFEMRTTLLTLFRRWRAKNMGIVILSRKNDKKDKENVDMANVRQEGVEEQSHGVNGDEGQSPDAASVEDGQHLDVQEERGQSSDMEGANSIERQAYTVIV